MCGIVGYIGARRRTDAREVLVDGLKRLEYRGYDSAGVSCVVPQGKKARVRTVKAVGKVAALEDKLARTTMNASLGIAHTRWATHGKPSVRNAHPHTAGAVTLVHNGIIENYQELKAQLQKQGRTLKSETDSEVVAHLIDAALADGADFAAAVRTAVAQLRGAYALAIICADAPDTLIAVKNSSPLVVGVAPDALIVASDAAAIVAHTSQVLYPADGEMLVARQTDDGVDYRITSLGGALRRHTPTQLEWDAQQAQKDGYAHFMLKEIFEQPHAVEDALRGRIVRAEGVARLGGLASVERQLRAVRRIIIVSCGTSYHAGLVGEYMLEEYAGIPTEVEYASEFRYRKPLLDTHTAVIAISQSGETADTLAAIAEAKRKGALTLGIVNAVGSTIARETDAGVYNHAGPEIGVASTKAFTSQLTILVLLTVLLGRQRAMSLTMGKRILTELTKIPRHIETICADSDAFLALAQKYARYDNFLYIARTYNFPIALEGALKIKEIAYVHAEGYASGEMKHGPIALIDKNFPTVAIVPRDSVYEKDLAGIEEIKARGGRVLAITTADAAAVAQHVDDVITIPKTLELLTPLLAVVPLQFLAYGVGVARGLDVDKPRNLAKSVTVE